MSGVEFNTWKVADLKAQLKAKVKLESVLRFGGDFIQFVEILFDPSSYFGTMTQSGK